MSHRKCDVHGEHGSLYICPSYSEELQEKLKIEGDQFARLCRSGEIEVVHQDREGKIIWKGKLKDMPETKSWPTKL